MNAELIKKYKDVITEVHRFEKAAQSALKRLETDTYAAYGSKETAQAKRASLDLTRALARLRNPNV